MLGMGLEFRKGLPLSAPPGVGHRAVVGSGDSVLTFLGITYSSLFSGGAMIVSFTLFP